MAASLGNEKCHLVNTDTKSNVKNKTFSADSGRSIANILPCLEIRGTG